FQRPRSHSEQLKRRTWGPQGGPTLTAACRTTGARICDTIGLLGMWPYVSAGLGAAAAGVRDAQGSVASRLGLRRLGLLDVVLARHRHHDRTFLMSCSAGVRSAERFDGADPLWL